MARRMHTPVREQHQWLCQVLKGHYQYYGVIFNYRALRAFKTASSALAKGAQQTKPEGSHDLGTTTSS